MKLIIAIIQPETLSAVSQALNGMEVVLAHAGKVADVRHMQSNTYRGTEYRVSRPRLRLEILVVNEMAVPEILEAIRRTAFMNDSGPDSRGHLLVMHLDDWFQCLPAHRADAVSAM